MPRLRIASGAWLLGLLPAATLAAAPVVQSESAVPPYSLPPLLAREAQTTPGHESTTAWNPARRHELLALFATHIYGTLPPPPRQSPRLTVESHPVLELRAERRQVRVDYLDSHRSPFTALRFTVLIPQHASHPIPTFVGLHLFDSSHHLPRPAVARDVPPNTDVPKAHQQAGRAITELILARNYALATLDLDDLAPDSTNLWSQGVLHRLDPRPHPGPPGPTETGALGLWAWGLSRFVDAVPQIPELDPTRIIAIGHSRMGKAALWAAANDDRFAAVISNNSGCAGAALSRRIFGETVEIITRAFPHWFCGNFTQYAQNEHRLPIDQHHLLALVAPRPLYVASAAQDLWADPTGEYLATRFATPAWHPSHRVAPEFTPTNPPPIDQPIGTRVRYHLRSGRHDLTDYDWRQFLDFADQEVRHRPTQSPPSPSAAATLPSPPRRAPFASLLRQPTPWWRSPEAMTIASNILSFQSVRGDWPKNTNTTAYRFTGSPHSLHGTWDNGASVGEIRFLARLRTHADHPAAGEAVRRAVNHILAAQYPSGGWPQSHPPGPGYHRHITFNDGTMVRLLELLREIRHQPEFAFLPEETRNAAGEAFDRGIDAILRAQIRTHGTLTVWCAQHDEVTLEPRPGRTFEPASLSGAESAGILRLLMSLEAPTPAIQTAIHAGAAWFARSALTGIRLVTRDGNRQVEPDPAAPPLWARFYELSSNRPIFLGRDSVVKYRLADIEAERRNGYAWYGSWGHEVARRYATWQPSRPADPLPPQSISP